MPEADDSQRARAEALLRRGSTGDVTEATKPDPPAEELGAADALSLRWVNNSVVATVYLFDSYDDASDMEDRLSADVPESVQSKSTVNGSLLLWATADGGDEDARRTLKTLVSAFAGRERRPGG
jgi:hypothetical protein